jgi:nucleoside-diphosphate-sugar epimerase
VTGASQPLFVLTGPTGFIGSAIRRGLETTGARGRLLVSSGKLDARPGGLVPVEGRLPRVPSTLFPDQPFILLHFAVLTRASDERQLRRVNVEGTRNLLGQLGSACKGIIHSSSLSVLGNAAQARVGEDAALSPETPLARTRAEAEGAVAEVGRRRGISAISLRPRFVVGSGDRHTLPSWIEMVRRGACVGDGTQLFSLIDVDDYARVVLRLAFRLMERDQRRAPLFGAMHVAYEQPLSLSEIVNLICAELALPLPRRQIRVDGVWQQVLKLLPIKSIGDAALRVELAGRTRTVKVDRLAEEIGHGLLARDPREPLSTMLRRSVRRR